MPNTPSGTRMRPTWMPLGRRFISVISPTGSGIAASCSQPSATVSRACAVSCKRSTIGAANPAACAAATSFALAACKAAALARSRRANATNAAFLAAVGAAAIAREAARAATPTWAM
jgi:hypothetical protein